MPTNFKLVAEDNNYPQKGGIAALVGIYPTETAAELIRKIVSRHYQNSTLVISPTEFPVTVKYIENFLNNK